MSAIEARPTFMLESDLSALEIIQRLKSVLAEFPNEYDGQFTSHHAMISIHASKRHFWSPWLQLEIRPENEQQHIFGRFSPNPSIWTGFMFLWLSIAVLVFFAAMFGISQQLTGLTPWAYWIIPTGIIVALILWLAAKAGQKFAQNEMQQIQSTVEHCLQIKS